MHTFHETSRAPLTRADRLKVTQISPPVHHDCLRRQTASAHLLDGRLSLRGGCVCSPSSSRPLDSMMHQALQLTFVIHVPPPARHCVLGICGGARHGDGPVGVERPECGLQAADRPGRVDGRASRPAGRTHGPLAPWEPEGRRRGIFVRAALGVPASRHASARYQGRIPRSPRKELPCMCRR